MKKAFIGAVLFIGGILCTIGSLLCAAIALPTITSWGMEYPSRLFSVLFEGNPNAAHMDMVDGLEGIGLGGLFVAGIILLCIGLIILIVSYCRKDAPPKAQ